MNGSQPLPLKMSCFQGLCPAYSAKQGRKNPYKQFWISEQQETLDLVGP